ncbi:MAG: hypothetical protein SPI97_07000 [Oscillospiraceae bacterium]|nr:hypothetical protein [Oscillospiraceae bacterium]
MDKEKIIKEESDNLGSVIKMLVDFDAQQREIIASALSGREAARKDIQSERSEIEEKYMKRAEERLKKLEQSENERADKAIKAAQEASLKNIAELEKTAAEKKAFWVEQIYERTVNGK